MHQIYKSWQTKKPQLNKRKKLEENIKHIDVNIGKQHALEAAAIAKEKQAIKESNDLKRREGKWNAENNRIKK